MISYNLLTHAIVYYEDKGFKRIEVPWAVSASIDDITKPKDKIHYQLKHNDKCLIGSGEQGFLYLYCKDYLPKGRYQTITPCWRDEPYDGMHAKCFMKNELIITDNVNNDTLKEIIDAASGFFHSILILKLYKLTQDMILYLKKVNMNQEATVFVIVNI